VTIGKVLGAFECRFVVRAADFGSVFNVAVFTQV
jgi:hypothetical protein